MSQLNYYYILGVTPDAEDIVITAAYRALAQRYHPDKWQGDSSEAQRRMTAINEAYSVLRDPVKRVEYDRSQQNESHYFDPENSTGTNEAFDAALMDVEERWKIACSIFPDLEKYQKNLKKISTPLAFSYVMYLLETKSFNHRESIYENMEFKFLERYFGSNLEVINFAKQLIQNGKKDDAKKLNKIIDTMGESVDPKLIFMQFGIKNNNYNDLLDFFNNSPTYYNACELAKSAGFKIREVDDGFIFPKTKVLLTTNDNKQIIFEDKIFFLTYIKDNFIKN